MNIKVFVSFAGRLAHKASKVFVGLYTVQVVALWLMSLASDKNVPLSCHSVVSLAVSVAVMVAIPKVVKAINASIPAALNH